MRHERAKFPQTVSGIYGNISDYRNDIRLTHARSKLQSGEYNVSEAAFDSGFSNLSFFIRLYKKKYGHTPKNE